MGMAKPRIILDCDPGHDDAIALLLAAQHCDVLGVTAVSGNVPLALTTHNALLTTQILGLETPVYAGANRPLVAEPRHAEFIHGETGLGGPELPELRLEVAGHNAVQFIIDTARAEENLWLVATGPLTNVALALRSAPDLAERLAGISLMGGSASFGNVTPVAEFNIWADPEAAEVVFGCGAKIVMSGLNVTHQFMIREEDIADIRGLESEAALFTADMLDFYAHAYANKFYGRVEGPLHDPCAVLAVTHPELFNLEARHVGVETRGQRTRGMTVVDERGVKESEASNVQVAYEIHRARALDILLEAIRAYA